MPEKDCWTLHCEFRQQWIDDLEDRTCAELKFLETEYLKLEFWCRPLQLTKHFTIKFLATIAINFKLELSIKLKQHVLISMLSTHDVVFRRCDACMRLKVEFTASRGTRLSKCLLRRLESVFWLILLLAALKATWTFCDFRKKIRLDENNLWYCKLTSVVELARFPA